MYFSCRFAASPFGFFDTTLFSWNKGYDAVYTVDFTKLTQTNKDSGTVRKIRRIEIRAVS